MLMQQQPVDSMCQTAQQMRPCQKPMSSRCLMPGMIFSSNLQQLSSLLMQLSGLYQHLHHGSLIGLNAGRTSTKPGVLQQLLLPYRRYS